MLDLSAGLCWRISIAPYSADIGGSPSTYPGGYGRSKRGANWRTGSLCYGSL